MRPAFVILVAASCLTGCLSAPNPVFDSGAKSTPSQTRKIASDLPPSFGDIKLELQGARYSPERSFYAYNYSNVPESTNKSGLSAVSERYWTRSVAPGSTLPGYYAAADPRASRGFSFSGDTFHLERIEIPRDVQILDVSSSGRPAPSPLARAYLSSQGCDVANYAQIFSEFWSDSCRQIQVQLLKSLDIDAVKYSWRSAPMPDCTGTDPGAYIIVNPSRITHVRVFGPKDSHDDLDEGLERGIIQSLLGQGPGISPIPGVKARPPQKSAVRAYEADHLLNCANLVRSGYPN